MIGVPGFRGSRLRSSSYGEARRSVAKAAGVLVLAVVMAAALAAPRELSRPALASAAAPTFADDVAPIIYASCTVCHRPGQSAPFSLVSYDDVRKRGQTIVDVTSRRYMPPWHAARAAGFPEMRDERRLSDRDISTLKQWVDAGMPLGDARKVPVPPVFPGGWALGVPDLIVQMPRPMFVPADGPDLFRNVLVEVDMPEDRWIRAIDFAPSARAVVHHALFFAGPAGAVVRDEDPLPGLGGLGLARARGTGAAGPGNDGWTGLGGWVPGVTPRFFPDGIAQPFPRHSNIVMQLHFHPSGRAEREDGQLAVYFSTTPPKKSLTGVQVPPLFGFAMGIDIPAGERRYTIRDSFVLPVDVEAFGARGHAHYLGRQMKMTATLPGGATRGLLWIADWDFAWQDSYFFKTPEKLPKGTRIDVEITYDNSDANPRNPRTPPERVTWGRESLDEMGSMTLLVTTAGAADNDALRAAQTQHFRMQLLKRFPRSADTSIVR
jgi:hypothetical protein